MRYLGLDLGSKTLGVAIGDTTHIIATPYETVLYKDFEDLFSKLKIIIDEFNITDIIIGNPLNMHGTESKRSIESKKLKEVIENKLNLNVYLIDERLTTIQAEKLLINNKTRRSNRKKVIDKLAATIILQTYLDRRSK